MSHLPKKGQLTDLSSLKKPVELPPVSEISIARLLDDGLLILFREIHNLKVLSANGKLESNDARDLRDHLRLLFDLKDREHDLLKGLTDDQLKALIEQAKNEKI